MRRSIIPIVVTLLFAAGLWLAVNLAGDVQTTIHIAFAAEIPYGLASSSPLPRQISATVRGPGWSVLQFAILGKPACRVDLNELASSRSSFNISQRTLRQSISLPSQLVLTDIDPDSIIVTLDPIRERNVPVEPALKLECRRGFEQSSPVRAEPDSVRISGASSVVKNISSWSTEPASIINAVAPVRMEIALADSIANLVTLPQQKIFITADVQETAERIFYDVPVHVINVPSGMHVRVAPAFTSVLVRGGAETLATLTVSDIHATADYLEFAESANDLAAVRINAPSHVSVLKLKPHLINWFVRHTP